MTTLPLIKVIIDFFDERVKSGVAANPLTFNSDNKSVFVITDYSTEIGKDIMEKMDVSVTYIDAEGGYSGIKKRIVYCVISRLQVQKLKEIAKTIDPRAFIAIENVYEVEGVRIKKRKI